MPLVSQIKIKRRMTVSNLAEQMEAVKVLGAGRFGKAARIISEMYGDRNYTNILSLAGPLIPGGLRTVIRDLEEGYIVGVYGLLLRRCAETALPAITLLTQSHYNYPDPEAAGAALTAVNRILDLKVDVSELLKRGEEIRLRSKDMMHRTHEEMNKMDKSHEYDLPPL